MGILAALGLAASPAATSPVAVLEAAPVAVGGSLTADLGFTRAALVAQDIALSIPAVRKAVHVIAGTIGTFTLAAWQGETRLPDTDGRVAFLTQPDPRRTLQWILTRTVQDIIWRDRAVWRITDRTLYNTTRGVERLHPHRYDIIEHPRDPDTITSIIIDGDETSPDHPTLVVFDGAGLGGLRRHGFDLLTLYGELQAAAGRYAVAPHPHAILKNHGADLTDDEIETLLQSWETARARRSVGYLNDVVDYEANGWSAKELQLTEAREHAALEVARIFGLPAKSLDAKSGDAMTYSTTVEWRKEEVKALRPWMTVIDQTLSMDDRTGRPSGLLVPHGITVRLDTADYLRDDAKTRMDTWNAALERGVLTPEEVRAAEPLARSAS